MPATIQLGGLVQAVPDMEAPPLEMVVPGTFQEVTLEKRGNIGIIGFDFYNGAMSTSQC